MKSGIPWNLRRVDDETRQAVIEAARRSGLTVGEWLNHVLAPQGQSYAEPENTRSPEGDLTRTLARVRDRLDEIERGMRRAPVVRTQKSVPEMVAELAREIENSDERARSSVEGLRGRAAAARPQTESDRIDEAVRALDRQLAEMGRRIAEPAPASEPTPVGLDDIRNKLDTLLAQAPKSASVREDRRESVASVEAALKALEGRVEEARAELGARESQAATGEQFKRLEAQLAEIDSRLSNPEARGTPGMDSTLASAIREISAHQRAIDDRAETLAMRRDQKALAAAMTALRTDIASLGEEIGANGRVGAEERMALLELSRRIDALAAEAPIDRNLMAALREDLDALHATVEGLAREETVQALAARHEGLAAQINALVAGSPNRRQVEAIGEEVTLLRQMFEADDSPRTIRRLETRIAEIGDAVDMALAAQTDPGPVLEQLEERLKEISSGVEGLRRAGMPGAVSAAVDAAQRQVETQMEDLVSQLGGLFAAMPRQAATLETIEERLQTVVHRIDNLSLTQGEPAQTLDAIQSEIRALRAELAERPGGSVSTEHLEAQIRDLAGQLQAVASSTPDAGGIGALERQVEVMAGELEDARPRLAAVAQLEQNLSRLQALLADTTRESIVGARAEAQQAVTQLSEIVAEYEIDSDLVRSLMRDLDSLKSAAGSSDATTHARLESVSETLAEVVERLGRLEREAHGASRDARTATAIVAAPPAAAKPVETDRTVPSAPEKAADRRADFIAAARRAAHAATVRATTDESSPAHRAPERAITPSELPKDERKPGAFARISLAIRNRKRSLLLAAAAIVIAIGAIQIFGKLATAPEDDASISSAAVAPAPPATQFRDATAEDAVATAGPTVPTVPQVKEPAMIPPSATPDAAIAFAEPEALTDRFQIAPATRKSAGFGPQSVDQGEDSDGLVEESSARVPDAASQNDRPRVGYATGLDPRLGDDLLLSAADEGDPGAAFEVARRYAEGTRVPKDLGKAADWYRRAAEGGVAVAQYRLASLYERGQSVERNPVEAVNWYQRAADQGNVNAMHNLAVMMSEGVEGPPDHDKALQWFLAAGNYGVRDSQYNLGVIYARGLGPEQDLVESYKWFAIAAAQGDRDAEARRDEVAKAMSPEELATAKSAVSGWHSQPTLAEANGVTAPAGGWDGPGDGLAMADREALVRKIQVLLAEQGYDPGPADGVIGPKTVDAVRAYQRRIGQPETGEIDNTLVAALANGAP